MPANRHWFREDWLPETIVADSSFLFEATMETGDGSHDLAVDFLNRLRNHNSVIMYSSLVFIEAPQCWRRMYARGFLGHEPSGIDMIEDRIRALKELTPCSMNCWRAFDSVALPSADD